MDRHEFEQFRDLADKAINTDIAFTVKGNHESILAACRIPIQNSLGLDAKLEIHYNPDADSKVFVIHIAEAGGPVCRLCVDNGPHPPCMHSHKHALWTSECPRNKLPLNVEDKPELDGKGIVELFTIFCELTNIHHSGTFSPPAGA